jgi:hypothetical protein
MPTLKKSINPPGGSNAVSIQTYQILVFINNSFSTIERNRFDNSRCKQSD